MKVKNIAFSGFMAAILIAVSGAADATTVNLVSKTYVDEALGAKQDALTAGQGIEIVDNVVSSTVDVSEFVKKGEIPELSAFATSDELDAVKKALQDEIAAKHAAGDYATVADLQELQEYVDALTETNGADKAQLESLQTIVNAISDDYAKKTELDETEIRLQSAINAIKVPTMTSELTNDSGYITESALTAYAKTADVDTELDKKANVSALESYALKSEIPSVSGLVTGEQLTELQNTLQAAIDDKQAKGEYLTASSLANINDAIVELQSGKADATVVDGLKTTLQTISDDYAKKTELDAVELRLQNAINAVEIPALDAYATKQFVEENYVTKEMAQTYATKAELPSVEGLATTEQLNAKQDKLTAGANISISADNTISANVDLTDYAKTEQLSDLVTSEQLTKLQNTLQAAIDDKQAKGEYAAAADLTKLQEEVAALQVGDSTGTVDTSALEARIKTIEDTYATDAELTTAIDEVKALIPSTDDFATKDELSAFVANPELPTEYGEYVLRVNIAEDGTVESYDWYNTMELMGGGDYEL